MKSLKIAVAAAVLLTLPTLLIAGNFTGFKSKTMSMDIVDTAVSAGNFNTLVTALTAADLIWLKRFVETAHLRFSPRPMRLLQSFQQVPWKTCCGRK